MTKVDSTHYTYVYNVQAGSGTATATMRVGTDVAVNVVTAAPTSGATFTVDNTAPTVSIGAPSATRASSGPVTYIVTYADTAFSASTLSASDITLNASGGATASIGVSGSGTTRTVTLTSITGNGTLGISLAAATAADTAGNTAPAAGPSTTFTVDNTGPAISSVSKPADGTYKAAQNLDFTVTFSEKVTVVTSGGIPAIGLTIGATARNASYLSGSGTTALLFRYTTVSGDNDADGIAVAPAITLNGGTIADAAGNNASLSFTAPNASAVKVDATAPTAALSYSPASSAKAGSALTITATFSEPIADSPVVKLAISAVSGGTALAATNMTKVDSTHYKYVYTAQAGNGAAAATMSVGTDLAGNVVTAAPASGATFTVDNTAPTVSIGAPSATRASSGPVTYIVTYADTAFSSSTLSASDITLNASGGATASIGVAGSGTTRTVTLTSITGNGTLGISLAAATAGDTAGNTAPAAGPSTTFTVDNIAPAISSVSKPADGTYKAGQNLDFTVTFSENVTVVTSVGRPAIGLTIGSTARSASYVSGSGTSALLFRYTTASGDNDGDGIAVAPAITLNGGTIADAAGNNAGLSFTAPNAGAVKIDSTAPTAALTYSPASSAKAASSLTITATFSEPLANSPAVKLAISAVTGGTAL